MRTIPVVCDRCNFIFPTPIKMGDNATLIFNNCMAGPCPLCGAMGHIPDGTFKLIDNVIHILNAPSKSTEELKSLAIILEKVNEDKMSLQDAVNGIDNSLSEIKELLVKNNERKVDLKFIITTILTVIGLILSLYLDHNPTIQVEQVVNNIYQFQTTNNIYEINNSGKLNIITQKKCKNLSKRSMLLW